MLRVSVMWIIQMWVCNRSDKGGQAHIIPKTWAQIRKIKYFCSDTGVFQQFLQLVWKRTLPARDWFWLAHTKLGDVAALLPEYFQEGESDGHWKEQQEQVGKWLERELRCSVSKGWAKQPWRQLQNNRLEAPRDLPQPFQELQSALGNQGPEPVTRQGLPGQS